ncbi:MAG: peptidase inhibitor I78 [Variovorax sp.]|nr:MAG: peptidase inhibitor I78 [Variovorax sp.]
MKHAFLFALATAGFLAGCAGLAPAPQSATAAPVAAAPAAAPPARCQAEGARFAVGQLVTPQLEAAARFRGTADSVRVIKPGQAVTMEINEGRLNLDVDARGRVTDVRCG